MSTVCGDAFKSWAWGCHSNPHITRVLAELIQEHKNLPLSQRRPYYKKVLVRAEDSCIVRIIWAPEGRTRPHKHGGSSAKIYVLQGALAQELFALWDEGCGLLERCIHSEGEEFDEDPETIHRIGNASPFEWAVSLHIFEPALKAMEVFDFAYNERWTVHGDEDTMGEAPSDAVPIWPKQIGSS